MVKAVATMIDEEFHKYLDEAYQDIRILNENIEVLHAMAMAKALMEVETINSEQVMNLFSNITLFMHRKGRC